ncbi:MAG: hypothetical protein ACK5EW_04210 [Bacteroidota bacterium]|jgi:hypothetical protein|nr:hypothetical protein [Bacteroidota bacterium]
MKAFKLFFLLLFLVPLASHSQCRPFTKNKVLPKLNGYVQNDSYNAAQLAPGEEAEVLMTFFGGRDYRLLVVAHPILGEVEFTVNDINGKAVYTNKGAQNKEQFDFHMDNTAQLVVKIKVPPVKDAVYQHIGCVSIMSGFKQ